jgi:putative FmdB family regulatory protein
MPIYEYECQSCGYRFERMQSYSDSPLTACPDCQGRVRRVISGVGVVFRGSGFYITDSKRQLVDSKAGHDGVDKSGAETKTSGGEE